MAESTGFRRFGEKAVGFVSGSRYSVKILANKLKWLKLDLKGRNKEVFGSYNLLII